jgi:hypothetical protein
VRIARAFAQRSRGAVELKSERDDAHGPVHGAQVHRFDL